MCNRQAYDTTNEKASALDVKVRIKVRRENYCGGCSEAALDTYIVTAVGVIQQQAAAAAADRSGAF